MSTHFLARGGMAILFTVCLLPGSACAQTWPTKPITLIVPSAPGGAADLSARTLARFLTQQSGANVVVEDKAGAGGIIGTAVVAQAAPDGYTFLLSTNSTQSANQFLYKKLPYDAAKDFVDIGLLGKFGTVAVVAPASPINSLAELVASARQNPGKVFFGYYSSSSRVPPELLKHYANLQTEGVAYKNVTQILTDLRSNQIQFAFVDYLTAMGQIEGKNLKPIAVTGAKRNPMWPAVATTDGAYPGFIVEGWLGLSAPKGTPNTIVEKMNAYIKAAIADPATRTQYAKLGLLPESMDVGAFQKFVRQDVEHWKEWIKTAQIPAE
jgi:tripartite-type tricarboxylate transporter receptor subunit TctC